MDTINQLKELLGELRSGDENAARALWTDVRRLLKRTRADTLRAAQVCAGRDVDGLAALIERAEALLSEPEPTRPARRAPSSGVATSSLTTQPRPAPGSASAGAAGGAAGGATGGGPYEPTAQDLRMAMKAFRKRLKLTRLDDESRIGGRALTGGRGSEIDAIIPPTQFRKEVWAALAAQGQLRHTGGGFYALTGKTDVPKK